MINLLSSSVRHEVTQRYYTRLVIAGMLVVVMFLFLGIVFLIPSYLVALEKERAEVARAEELRTNEAFQENQALSDTVETTKQQIAIVRRMPHHDIYPVMQTILAHMNDSAYNVGLRAIEYRVNSDDVMVFDLQGRAASRSDLLAVIDVFKEDVTFTQVDVPVSSFVQNTNISFRMTLYVTASDI